MRTRHGLVTVLLFLSAVLPATAKKLIETGWDMPDTKRLRENFAAMEQQPFDGAIVQAVGKPGPLSVAFSNITWRHDDFQNCLDDLRACRFNRFRDNFVLLGANPGNVDWFDDAGWQTIVEHWRIAAWLAKHGGLRGILFDPEPYTEPHAQFKQTTQPQAKQHSFDDYRAKARQRGREVMQAVAAEFSDLTLFCYFMNSVQHGVPRPSDGYGLYPAFIDGWLDAAPPTVTFVDGCENAYTFKTVNQYLEAAVQIKGTAQEHISPANRSKYRAQVQVSFGIYLDAYANPPTSPWHVPGKTDALRNNVTTALRVADEYVWVYGEKSRWWPTRNKSANEHTWEETLPGCTAVLGFVRDPVGWARDQIARQPSEVKLAGTWDTWQADGSHGSFKWDKGALTGCATQVVNGCFIQSVPAQPGERYAVRAKRRHDGWLRVRWQTADHKWTHELDDQIFTAPGPSGQWSEIFGVVTVPEGVGRLVILLCVEGHAEFDAVHLYRLP